jgi:hypothetical protein
MQGQDPEFAAHLFQRQAPFYPLSYAAKFKTVGLRLFSMKTTKSSFLTILWGLL